MKLTAQQIVSIFPKAAPFAEHMAVTADRYNINTTLRQAHWLAQMAVESGGYTVVRESLNYAATALVPLFGSHRITQAQAHKYGRRSGQRANQEAIANIVYGGAWGFKNLGNTEPGDGWWFIGRGLKQTTGRSNYTRTSMALFGDTRLLGSPQVLEDAEWAALSSGTFWQYSGLNALADTGDVARVTKRVNGGTNGLAERRGWTARCLEALSARPDFSGVTVHVTSTAKLVKGGE